MIDFEKCILEVKRRPVLWDPNHADYNQRHSKLAAWEEVLAILYEDWYDLSNYDKFGKVRDIQNKWKNIRDSYIRELKYERKVEKGLAMAKKSKYKYSHLLEFLNLGDKRKSKGSDQSSTDVEESPKKKESLEIKQLNFNLPESKPEFKSAPMEFDHRTIQVNMNGNRRTKRLKHDNNLNLQSDSSTMDSDCNNRDIKIPKQSNTSNESLQQMNCSVELERNKIQTLPNSQVYHDYFNNGSPQNINAEYLSPSVEIHPGFSTLPLEQDDDKMFLLSLLPYFKKLNEERKLQARIEMSTLLQKLIYRKS